MPDNLTPAQRSHCMSRVKSKDTGLEVIVRRSLRKRGLKFEKHARDLPGSPDLVFRDAKVAVFIDGDFWHGWRFPAWKHPVTPFWREKIEKNRRRDAKNFRKLRRDGWTVVRLWQHQISRDLDACIERIMMGLRGSKQAN